MGDAAREMNETGDDNDAAFLLLCICPPVGLIVMILDFILYKVTGDDLVDLWQRRKKSNESLERPDPPTPID
jgi:hypothetical protein